MQRYQSRKYLTNCIRCDIKINSISSWTYCQACLTLTRNWRIITDTRMPLMYVEREVRNTIPRSNEDIFDSWCIRNFGYPIVFPQFGLNEFGDIIKVENFKRVMSYPRTKRPSCLECAGNGYLKKYDEKTGITSYEVCIKECYKNV